MRTMFLASSGHFITNELHKYLDKKISEYNIAYITTAKKWVDDLSYIEKRKSNFDKVWLKYKEIDIEWKSEEELIYLLNDKNIVYVEWWNTFYLMKAINSTKFKHIVERKMDNWTIYVGSSAGSYIACPHIEMATWKTNKVRDKYWLNDLSGLSWVNFLVFVHYKPEYKAVLKRKISTSKYKIKILTNEQALMIKWEEITIIGKWKEIKL